MPGEGSTFQRKSDGRWVAALSVGTRTDRVIYRRYAHTRGEARTALEELKAGIRQPTNSTSLGAYLERWVNEARGIRDTTRRGYKAVVTYHLAPTIGHIPIGSLSSLHVEQMLRDLEERVSPKTARNVHVVLRRALGQAVRAEIITKNVAAREYVDAPRVPDAEPDALTETEVRRLLAAAKGDRLEALFVLAVGTGLRQGELLGLAWEDIDLARGELRVRKELARVNSAYQRVDPKTERSKRTVPLAQPVADALTAHRQALIDDGYIPIGTGPVFINTTGGELSGSWLTHHFYRLLAEAGIDRRPFKILRATFASRLEEAGVSEVVIARLMGHTRTHTSRKHYIADRPEAAVDAVARLVG